MQIIEFNGTACAVIRYDPKGNTIRVRDPFSTQVITEDQAPPEGLVLREPGKPGTLTGWADLVEAVKAQAILEFQESLESEARRTAKKEAWIASLPLVEMP